MHMDASMESPRADALDSDPNYSKGGEAGPVAMDIDQPRDLVGDGQGGFDFGAGGGRGNGSNNQPPAQSYTTPNKLQPSSHESNNTVLSRRLSSKMSLGPLNSPTFFPKPNVNIPPSSSSSNGTNIPSAPNSALSASFTTHRSPVAGVPDTPNGGPNGVGEAKSPRLRSEGISPPVGEGSPTPSGAGTGFGFGFGGGGKQNQGGGGVAQSPFAGVPANSPWAHLAAAAGAPTPSLDGPGGTIHSPFGYSSGSGGSSGGGAGSGGLAGNFSFPAMLAGGAAGRSISPHLGAPFEMLNIGNGNGNPVAGPSKSPMGWPGVVAGEAVQTPGIAAAGMADPFSSLPVAGSGSGSAAGASPGGNGFKFNMGSNSSSTTSLPAAGGSPAKREGGFALDAMAAFAAKRRGSKSGPSSLSKSATPSTASSVSEGKDGQSSRSRTGSVEDMKLPSGPVAGPGRLPNSTNGGMKLNLPAGLGARPAGISSTSASASATPGTSLSASSTPGMSMSKLPGGKTASPLLPYPLHASQIPGYLDREPGEALLLDLRPPSSFNNRRLPRSLSVPVPSTLLKRQTFDLQKIAQMLPAKQNQLIMDFRQAKDIIILDHDSVIAGPGSVIAGLATKFGTALQSDSVDNEWQGKIWFVKGGFVACEEVAGIDFAEGEEPADGPGAEPGAVYGAEAKVLDKQGRMVGALDPNAFRQGERKSVAGRAQPPKSLTLPSTPMVKFDLGGRPALGGDNAPRTLSNAADAPMSPTNRASTTTPNGTGQPRTGRGEVTEATTLQPANPFFDNIRQNLELAHGGITERIQLQLPPDVYSRLKELPPFLRDIVGTSPETVATKVAKEFEGIERDEQRRLQGIMEWHSRGSQVTQPSGALPKLRRLDSTGLMKAQSGDKEPEDDDEYFPFSITAGVERGSKNRYKNIWPYDFSRVRLKERCHDDGSDYINANFVQPRGTTRRYIATQGPLDATFQDFWTLVWEQHIHVIVMLTKQFEGGSLKCGSYWTGGTYGPFKLELISTKGGEDEAEKDISGFDFHVGKSGASQDAPNIKRSFLLTHAGQADVKPRKIVQIQCVSWPDFDVPEDPRTLLSLVKEVDEASGKLTDEEDEAERKPPVLVHCSAGVGRTGSFMIVDSILEALRREHNRQHRKIRGSHSSLRTRRQSQQTGDSAHSDADSHSENGRSEHRRGSSASIILESHSPSTSILSRHGSHFPAMPSPLREFTQAEKDLRTTTASPDAMEAEAEPQAQPFWLKDGARRWSVTSGKAMKSPSIEHEFPDEMAFIPRIGGDQQVDREPSPISEMESPVKNVLAGMRIQRMSLVQSLRQYAFVYRAIIYGYLDMLDEEKEAEAEVSAMHAASRTPGGSGATTDEESHVKRRASPTSLSGASLSKRPSIKISRQPSDEKDGDGGSALVVEEGGRGSRGRGRAVSIDPSDSDSMDMD